MALPSNIEDYKDIISASGTYFGLDANDQSYYNAWRDMSEHSSMQTTSLNNNEKTYFCNYINKAGLNSPTTPTALENEILAQLNNKGTKSSHDGIIYVAIDSRKALINNKSNSEKGAKLAQQWLDDAKTKKKKAEYTEILNKFKEEQQFYYDLWKIYDDYTGGFQSYKNEWKSDFETARAMLKPPSDSSGNNTDGSGEDNSTADIVQDPSIEVPDTSKEDQQHQDAVMNNIRKMYSAQDPRLQRADSFLMSDENDITGIRVPFSSYTAATAFCDQTWKLEAGIAVAMAQSDEMGKKPMASQNVGFFKWFNQYQQEINDITNTESSNTSEQYANIKTALEGMNNTEKVVMQDTELLYKEDKFWGAQSIVNPYSLTRLTGGFSNEGQINYMYDIRDRRRFYGMSVTDTDDVLAVSNPTVTQIIEWGNSDAWGRTPYSFQDFVYCKYFGQIPNNRLITFRRYPAPCIDNLQFENMFGKHEQTTKDASGNIKIEKVNEMSEENKDNKIFSPHASVVTWFGSDTGNSLSSLLNFTTGTKWEDLEASVHTVDGNEGESKQAVIDRLLGNGGDHTNLFGGAEYTPIDELLQSGSLLSGKLTSYGKYALAMNGTIGMDQAAYDKISGALADPYDSTLKNRIQGPVNRISSVKKRKEGIEFNQPLSITCSYTQKAIGGINPKAALLDCLGNCLEMASPHAVFWGGGYKFMVKPQLYPFHDGGWRDSFMAKIYDGNILGDEGAIATVVSGIKKVGTDSNGNFSMDTLKSTLGSVGGNMLSIVGSAISSIGDIFGGSNLLSSLGNTLTGAGADMQGVSEGEAKSKANNFFNNLANMWHNKMIAETTQPKITGLNSLLIGAPVGEWHLTIGNPFNPIAVIGNLICSKMEVKWDEELGPDDFPIGFSVTYTIEHGMARDSDAIQSMFNRGMGKFYTLPDYMSTSSDGMTYVDKYTKDNSHGDTGVLKYKSPNYYQKELNEAAGNVPTNNTYKISGGTRGALAGNYNTQLVTKFTPLNNLPSTTLTVNQARTGQGTGTIAIIKSLAATRKLTGE